MKTPLKILIVIAAVIVLAVASLCLIPVIKTLKSNHEWASESQPSARPVHIFGTVDADDLLSVMVCEYGDDFRHDKFYTIRVKGNAISDDVLMDRNIVYSLIVFHKGMGYWEERALFADTDAITVDIMQHCSGDDYIKVAGSKSFLSLDEFNAKRAELFGEELARVNAMSDSLIQTGSMYSRPYYELQALLDSKDISRDVRDSLRLELTKMTRTGEFLSDAGQHYLEVSNELKDRVSEFIRNYIAASEPSLPMFYLLVDRLSWDNQRKAKVIGWIDLYDSMYADRFTECNLHEAYAKLKHALSIYEGMPFKDFTLPDLDGNMRSLSELIGGKVAVLELWASWCHACRQSCMSMKPLYEKYKDSGFEFVGVAREYKNDAAWRKAVKQDGYIWPNLIALEDNHYIWDEYGSGAVGISFLIGKDGTVLKIFPTAEEVETAILATE